MKTFKITLILLLVLLFAANKINAQETPSGKEIDKFSLGVNFGSLLAYGDIKNYNFWPTPDERKWGFGGVLNYQISPIVSFQLQGVMGKLAGIKRRFIGGTPANLKFEAEIYEGSINTTVSLNRWLAPHLKINDRLNFYAMAGIGLIDFRSQLRTLSDDKLIKEYGYANDMSKDKMTTETVFPFGFGVKFKATEKIDLTLESQMYNVYTDKLDAYVRAYNSDDKFGYTYIGVSYRFGKKEKHMEWLSPDDLKAGSDKLALDETNKKIDELKNKIAEIESKQAAATPTTAVSNDPRFDELNQLIDNLNKKVGELENKAPVTTTTTVTVPSDGSGVDAQRLDELNRKLAELDAKNADLSSRILNMSTTNVTYEGGRPILVSVFFEVNKSDIDKINAERVAAAARYMKNDPSVKIELVGHADKRGGQKYNELLSERRAKAVQKSLVEEYGIETSRISINYKGYNDPLSKQSYDVNRRVDFLIK